MTRTPDSSFGLAQLSPAHHPLRLLFGNLHGFSRVARALRAFRRRIQALTSREIAALVAAGLVVEYMLRGRADYLLARARDALAWGFFSSYGPLLDEEMVWRSAANLFVVAAVGLAFTWLYRRRAQ
jgi:hypothetical protein